ncbi:NAD(P)-dependent oxidoreductase [Cupriavidus necator]|uniref:NAD(P)-dependent oxidoreductase n=1 Tax=Cupriavidus necator TaxID=106590 RepID=UPI003ECFF01F
MNQHTHTVGLVAPGKIGLPFAANLIADGHTVWGYRRGSLAEFEAVGGKAARSPQEVAEKAQIVFTCVASADALDEVIGGPNGLLAAGRSDLLVVDIGAMALSRKLSARDRLRDAGIEMLDAPVSGTPTMVTARKGVVFASGEQATCERVRPFLTALGTAVVYAGEFGAGSKLKFVANTLVAVHTAAAAEAVALAKAVGLDLKLVLDTITASAATSTMFNIRAPMMAEGISRPVNGTVTGLVDVMDAILATASGAGAAMPLLNTAKTLYERACDDGYGEEDIAVMVKVLESLAVPA